MDVTLDEEDVLIIFDDKTHCCKSHSRENDFSKFHFSTSGRQQVSRLYYVSQTTTHVDHDQANELVLVLVLGSKAL